MAKFELLDAPRPVILPLTAIKANRLRYSRDLKLASVSDQAKVPHVLLLMDDVQTAYPFRDLDEVKRFRAALDNIIEAVELREYNLAGKQIFQMQAQ